VKDAIKAIMLSVIQIKSLQSIL